MSSISRIRKNAEEFRLKEIYNKMTPEQYQKGIQMAIDRTRKEMTEEYQRKLKKIKDEYDNTLKGNTYIVIDAMSIELLYELAVQMKAFDEEDPEIRAQIVEKVQEIFENTMKAIEKYSKYKNDRQAKKEFNKRKEKVLKFFKINFNIKDS